MADYLERLRLRKEDVFARILFLISRATAHIRRAEQIEKVDDWQRVALWGAAGSCMAESAALHMLAGEPDPHAELSRAGQQYLLAGLPYGLMVESLFTPEDEIEDLLSSPFTEGWLREIDMMFEKAHEDSPSEIGKKTPPANLFAINQQVYLCMTIVSFPSLAEQHKDRLKLMIDRMKAHPNLPHGPQSQVLHVQLDIIEPAFDAMTNSMYEGRARAVNALKRLALHYAESIESAQRNEYLWKNLWSPVDYLDLEIVCAAKCVASAFSDVNLARIVDEESIAAIPLLLAPELRRRPRLNPQPTPRTRR
jgi:hypothetical protein